MVSGSGAQAAVEDEYLDLCKASDMKDCASAGITYENRETRLVGDQEYRRELWKMGNDAETIAVNYYARRLDDDLICIIEAQCRDSFVETPAFCESWFD